MQRMTTGVTIEELLSDPRYESGELWDGRFVVREPSGGTHGCVELSIGHALMCLPVVRAFGRTMGSSTGYIVARDPDRVLSPDVSLLSFDRCPTLPTAGFSEGAPELAVEIRSPRDSWVSVVEKGGIWIGHGARLVWCVDPAERSVLVLRPGDEPQLVPEEGALDLQPLLAASIEASRLFEAL